MTIKHKWIKRTLAGALAGLLSLSLAACGGKDDVPGSSNGGSSNGGNAGQPQGGGEGGYVWVPKYYELPEDAEAEDTWYGAFSFVGNSVYYRADFYGEASHSSLMKLDLNAASPEPVEVMDFSRIEGTEEAEDSGLQNRISCVTACEDGSILLVVRSSPIMPENATEADWERRERETVYHVKKLAADGSECFDVDITERLLMAQEQPYPQDIVADKEGNFFIHNGSSYVWVFDKDGNHTASVPVVQSGQWGYIQALGILPDGRAAMLQGGSSDMSLTAYNADTKQFSDVYDNLPDCRNSGISAGPNGGVLLKGDGLLYEYDLEKKEYTELLNWINCDINPDYVDAYAALADGRIGAYTSDWSTGESNLILLEYTPASEVVQKEVITLGCMSLNQSLQSAIVNFNKSNDKYRIEVKEYAASIDWSVENAYQDAKTQFFNDILTGNAPDMFAASDVDLKMFAQKGLIEDLTPYLENSTVVKRADLFDSVLNAYTIGGTLCTIPVSFQISTLVGRVSELGEESGWTMAEMMAYAEQYPEAEIFPYATKDRVLNDCLMFDFDAWVNWETGECFFDTPEFKEVLEFANRFPQEANYEGPSEPILLMNHKALLQQASFSDPQQWQVLTRMFDEPITAIGYPSSNSNGVLAMGQDGICISASSRNKEAVWAFMESMLTEEAQASDRFMWGYPIRVSAYNSIMEEAMKADYQLDEEGNPVLDENGEPIELSHHSYGWGNDFQIDIYSVTQQEADSILKLIGQVDGIYYYNESLMNIITEETAPYFAGQKSVDEVVDIIQSRVRIYINESR